MCREMKIVTKNAPTTAAEESPTKKVEKEVEETIQEEADAATATEAEDRNRKYLCSLHQKNTGAKEQEESIAIKMKKNAVVQCIIT